MSTSHLVKSKIVDVSLPEEIVDVLDIWAARGNISRTALIAQMVRFGFNEVGRNYRLYRQVDAEIIIKNNWHDPKYVK